MKISEVIITELRRRGKTKKWLADKLGVSRQHVHHLCTSDNYTIKTAARIADALQISTAELIRRSENIRDNQAGEEEHGD